MQEGHTNPTQTQELTPLALQGLYELSLGEASPERATAREQLRQFAVKNARRELSLGRALDWVKRHLSSIPEEQLAGEEPVAPSQVP